jgi:hypothetical protein
VSFGEIFLIFREGNQYRETATSALTPRTCIEKLHPPAQSVPVNLTVYIYI